MMVKNYKVRFVQDTRFAHPNVLLQERFIEKSSQYSPRTTNPLPENPA